jgi:hypothetical protein
MARRRSSLHDFLLVIAATTLALSGAAPMAAQSEPSDAVRARDDRIADLERKLDVLASELERVRTQVAVPEEPELKSAYGLGPAASKIYGVERGLSIGGYGEANYRNFIGDRNEDDLDRADFLRLVLYFGYKFTENIVFNSEIEFEHASAGEETVSSDSGSVSVEFAALDFFWQDWANFRAGMLLLPMGFLNEVHEPPYYFGVTRPEVEQRIIPSTWRENGVGIFGRIGEDVEYRSYVTTGFNAVGFSDSGIRGGRQKGNRALAEDLAWTTRVDWTPEVLPGFLLGGSFYFGDSGQDQELDGVDVPDARLWIAEAHAQYEKGPWNFRALAAYSELSDTSSLNVALDRPRDRPIAEAMFGGYVEAAYDVWPTLFGNADKSLEPFFRVEYVDTQLEVPSSFEANDENTYWVFTPGLQFKPHPNVVLKLEYRNLAAAGGNRADELAVGMGFAF